MAKEFNVGFSKFREAYEYATLSEYQEEFDPLNVNMTSIKLPNYDKHQVYECLECGTLTTDPSKHELQYHR